MDPVKAVALVGLNPLLVIYGVGGGHNDLLMLAGDGGRRLRDARRTASGSAVGSRVLGRRRQADRGLLLPFALAAGGARLAPQPPPRAR